MKYAHKVTDVAKVDDFIKSASIKTHYATEPEKIEGVLSFDGRDSYLGFVSAWKSIWSDLVKEIRSAKSEHWQSKREELRKKARTMLLIRHEGKRLSRLHREAVALKASEVVAA